MRSHRPAKCFGRFAGDESEPFKDWRVSNNWFGAANDEWTTRFLEADRSNMTGTLDLVSTDSSHRDYLRLPTARSNYLGPFPPGPAPPEGNWFTRLQERWKKTQEDLKRMGLEEE